jgi:hypothetical protein
MHVDLMNGRVVVVVVCCLSGALAMDCQAMDASLDQLASRDYGDPVYTFVHFTTVD